jgi:hypothetical protein
MKNKGCNKLKFVEDAQAATHAPHVYTVVVSLSLKGKDKETRARGARLASES